MDNSSLDMFCVITCATIDYEKPVLLAETICFSSRDVAF